MSSRFGHTKRRPVIGETISAIALPRRQRADVDKLPGFFVRIVGLDDQGAVQVALVSEPFMVPPGAGVGLRPSPDEGAFAGVARGSRQRRFHDIVGVFEGHKLERRWEAR